MDFSGIISELKSSRLAARRYEQEGGGKFRDCVTVCRNGRLLFERFCYGEAAGTVCTLWGQAGEDGLTGWDLSASLYSGREEAPKQLTGAEGGKLQFDEGRKLWAPQKDYKRFSKAGLGTLGMLFSK